MKAQVLRRLEASLALISVYTFANHLCFRQESLTKTLQGTRVQFGLGICRSRCLSFGILEDRLDLVLWLLGFEKGEMNPNGCVSVSLSHGMQEFYVDFKGPTEIYFAGSIYTGTVTSWAASTILVHLRVRLVPRFCRFPVHLQLPLSACSIPSRRVLMAAPNNAPAVLDKE